MTGAREPVPGEQRQVRRSKVFLVAEVRDDTEVHRAHILDISARGARVHAPPPAEVGTSVEVTIDGETDRAAVVWIDQQRYGIRFPHPLDTDRLRRIIDAR